MKHILGFAFCVLATPAFSQTLYGNPEGCAREQGATTRSDSAVTFDLNEFVFHESFCRVNEATQINSGGTLLKTTCLGEGSEWELSFVVETTDDADTLIFYGTDSPEHRTEISLCQ